jgi:hypothetical protein
MKCYYYLSPDLASTESIAEDLHNAGVSDWFMHIICKDEAGLCRKKLHSSNYIETLDVVRQGLIGTVLGFTMGVGLAALMSVTQPFGANTPGLAYFGVIFLLTCFGTWQGGLLGVHLENKKLSRFHNDIDGGKYLILVYAHKNKEGNVEQTMKKLHPEAELVGVDAQFFNPFATPIPAKQPVRSAAR